MDLVAMIYLILGMYLIATRLMVHIPGVTDGVLSLLTSMEILGTGRSHLGHMEKPKGNQEG